MTSTIWWAILKANRGKRCVGVSSVSRIARQHLMVEIRSVSRANDKKSLTVAPKSANNAKDSLKLSKLNKAKSQPGRWYSIKTDFVSNNAWFLNSLCRMYLKIPQEYFTHGKQSNMIIINRYPLTTRRPPKVSISLSLLIYCVNAILKQKWDQTWCLLVDHRRLVRTPSEAMWVG